ERGPGRRAGAVRPDAARAPGGRRRTLEGALAERSRQRGVRRRSARRGRPPQRRRPLPLLVGGGDRRRPRQPAARLPRRDRELAPRLQHRHDRALGQRVPRRRGAHRRQPPVEPPRRHGDRPLPARAPPRHRRRPRDTPPRRRRPAPRDRQPARVGAPGDDAGAAPGVLPLRPGGPGPLRGCAGGVRRHLLDRPVRVDALHQRLGRRGDRHARLGPRARRPVRRRGLAGL
ncbi:MAG: POSSIBLE RNA METHYLTRANSFERASE (RNA METHYLASE), partial [uncultured Nocardioides sp.]